MFYKQKILIGDFETTVFDNQEFTEVWASAFVELYKEDVYIFNSIETSFKFLRSLKENLLIYYHNLKFDGTFWILFFLKTLKFKQAYLIEHDKNGNEIYKWKKDKDMNNEEIKYAISDMGQWYRILVKVKGFYIEFRDSVKLLPFKVKDMSKSFNTKHKKTDIEYKGFRESGGNLTSKEKEYIANDVLVVKECIEYMFNNKHTKLTIGSCCFTEWKKTLLDKYRVLFPDLTKMHVVGFKDKNADFFIRKSYKGAFCGVAPGKENKIFSNGLTLDVNSLYAYVQHSESGFRYPMGVPTFWKGDYIPDKALRDNMYYFIRIKTRFYLKEGYLPFIQIKDDYKYPSRKQLTTSDILDKKDGIYKQYYIDETGEKKKARVELTLTMYDFKLLKEHYILKDFEILGGAYFFSVEGIFDEYIDKYKKIKMESTGSKKSLSKLFLTNLYGKLASSDDSSFKIAYVKEDGSLGYMYQEEHEKDSGYIPIGSAITSHARFYTITAAQKNYYGKNKPGFIYADTDSLHLDLPLNKVKGIKIDKTEFGCWDLELEWEKAIFVRAKTYIEMNSEEVKVTCAGMGEKCKDLVKQALTKIDRNKVKKLDYESQKFLCKKMKLEDFKKGFKVPGNLKAKNICGGVLLEEKEFNLR